MNYDYNDFRQVLFFNGLQKSQITNNCFLDIAVSIFKLNQTISKIICFIHFVLINVHSSIFSFVGKKTVKSNSRDLKGNRIILNELSDRKNRLIVQSFQQFDPNNKTIYRKI